MSSLLPAPLRGLIGFSLFALNTAFWCLFIYPLAIMKWLVPNKKFRRGITQAIVWIGEQWIAVNDWTLAFTHEIHWDIEGVEGLDPNCSYLVCANHGSWVDIIILQHVFNRRIPFLRFFLKRELLFVPPLNVAWWALDYPFMKRHSREYLAKHPEKRGEDLETTRRAVERFKGSRISILNFLEGTRFTEEKHAQQKSPYRHLLQPKAGGFAFVLQTMGEQFDALLDVTILYPDGIVSLVDLILGRLKRVVVRVDKKPVPKELMQGNYLEDDTSRERIQAWVRELWDEKDHLMNDLLTREKAFELPIVDDARAARTNSY